MLDRIQALREANGNISINRLEREAGLTRGSVAKWDDHTPSYEKLRKVADYFGVPVSYLTGETDDRQGIKKDPTQMGEVDGLTDAQREAWKLLRQMDDETLLKFIAWMKAMRRQGNE